MTIRIGIMGYGNLGRGVECALKHNPDMKLTAVFTRRDPETVKILTEGVKIYRAEEAASMAGEIDVLILCGGSATDLPVQTPEYAKYFNVVDSFDTHAKIPEHFAAVDQAARESGHVAVISAGWWPLTLMRSGEIRRIPLGHASTHRPQPLQRSSLNVTFAMVFPPLMVWDMH